MEIAKKKTRAPKVSNMQMEYLISYMQNHIAFATNKLLGAKGKVTHDQQWQHLTEKLNSIEGPSKTVDNWKKLWCDQRNQARGRAAKGKAQRQLTGNIGEPVQLKDSDLKILSIIGGESSVGLPVKEVGLGKQSEDMVDATLILGLTNDPEDIENTDLQEIEEQAVREKQAVVIATTDITGDGDVTFIENTSLLNFPKQQNIYQINSPSCTSNAIATSSQCINNTSTSNASANITTLRAKLEESLKTNTSTSNISAPISLGKKRMKYSFVKEATSYFQNVQEDHSKYLQTISENLQRIASATEAQNELLRDSMNLHDRTLDILSETI